jgi:hypothetical protein
MANNVNTMRVGRGAANGVAPLDGLGQVPDANLPTSAANKGGTGQTAYAIGDILVATGAATLTKLAPGSAGTVLTSNGAGNAPSYQVAGGFASGTRMSFNQTTAPIGWTKDTNAATNDAILRLVTGTVGAGGSNAFSTFNGQASVGATTLTIAQIPSHTHTTKEFGAGTGTGYTTNLSGAYNTVQSGAQGGGQSHTHSLTTDIKYIDFILAQRN